MAGDADLSRSTRGLRIIIQTYVLLLLFRTSLGNSFEGETQYLERGRPGVAACPALRGAGLTPSDVDAVYWYPHGPIARGASPIIVKNGGRIIVGDGVPEEMYDVGDDLSLIINQVEESSARTYYCRLSPKLLAFQDASVPVQVIVLPDPEFPVVSPCDKTPSPSKCEKSIPADQSTINITCKVANTYPAVTLHMWSFPDGSNHFVQLTDAVIETERVTVPLQGNLSGQELLRTNNTFTTTASIEVEVGIGGSIIICNSSGPVPGKGNSTVMVISKEDPMASTSCPTSRSLTTLETDVGATIASIYVTIKKDDNHPSSDMSSALVVVTVCFAISSLAFFILFVYTFRKVKRARHRQVIIYQVRSPDERDQDSSSDSDEGFPQKVQHDSSTPKLQQDCSTQQSDHMLSSPVQ